MTKTSNAEPVKRKRSVRTARVLTTVLSTRLPISLVQTLDDEAKRRDIYTSELIRETLEARFTKAAGSRLFD